ncbi:MAG: DMT family transporter [Phycisphaerales bacterium]|nr:DMT family transporter [Phycisphaerales bacterium]
MRMTTPIADTFLLLAAAIWGAGFVAQVLGAEHVGPFGFTGLRFTIGTVLLLPLLFIVPWPKENAQEVRRITWRGGLIAGVVMTAGALFQQAGLGHTTASNGAFITSLYVVFVPLLGLFIGTALRWNVWLGVAIAAIGLALLGITREFEFNRGDPLVLVSAMIWGVQVIIVGKYSTRVEAIRFSMIQLGVTGLVSLVFAAFLGQLHCESILLAKWAILLGAAFPVAIAFTLQVLAQKSAPPAHAALIMSLESVFGMACGIMFLSERPETQQYIGAALMLTGVVVSQMVRRERSRELQR